MDTMDDAGSPTYCGDWMKRRRRTLDLTQDELAQRAGCSVFTLRKIESGERKPSKQLARLLGEALELPAADLDRFTSMARGALPPALPEAARERAPAPLPQPASRLPANLTPLVGREPELAALDRLLQDPVCRLLTLVGPGGIGKTRLAIEAARRQSAFQDGACFIALTQVTMPGMIVPAIADALGVALQGQGEPRLQLFHALRDRDLLLVLDNAEHLLEGAALFSDLLERAAGVKLLVTSRERLGLLSEWVFVIPGLPLPPAGQVEGVEEFAAVKLFVQSARRIRPGFALQGADREAAVRICRMVEGMPLGIELAAAWMLVLTCPEIAQEIACSLDFLATSMRDVPERQRSLRAVFDHSWSLLTAGEQRALGRLAIFQGGFGRAAAEQVAGATLPLLSALEGKSLVRSHEGGRYDLHEAVRQYAAERFAQDPACADVRARFGRFYLALLAGRERDLMGAAQREAIRELKREGGNLRAAWQWAVEQGEFALIGRALRSFCWLCSVGVLYREGVEQIETVVAALRSLPQDEGRQRVLGAALAQQAMLSFRQGIFARAVELYEESLTLLRPLGDPALLADPLIISGVILHLDGEYERAQARMAEGLAAAQAAGDRWFAAYATFNLGYIASLGGRYGEGYEQMCAGLAAWRELGDPSAIALGLNHISPTAIALGKLDEAEAYLHESLRLLTQVGDRWGMGTANRLLGVVALKRGSVAEAQCFLHRSLDLFAGFVTGWDVSRSLIYLGEAAAMLGDTTDAEQSYQEAFAIAGEVHAAPLALEALAGLAALYLRCGQVQEALKHAIVILGHRAATHETKERARLLRAGAESRLAPAQVRAVEEWAGTHGLEAFLATPPGVRPTQPTSAVRRSGTSSPAQP